MMLRIFCGPFFGMLRIFLRPLFWDVADFWEASCIQLLTSGSMPLAPCSKNSMKWGNLIYMSYIACVYIFLSQSESQVPRLDSGSENNNTLFEPLPKVVVQEEVAEPMRGATKIMVWCVCVGCVGSRWLQHVSTRIYLNTFFLTNYIRTKNKKTNEIFVVHIFVYQRGVQVVSFS